MRQLHLVVQTFLTGLALLLMIVVYVQSHDKPQASIFIGSAPQIHSRMVGEWVTPNFPRSPLLTQI